MTLREAYAKLGLECPLDPSSKYHRGDGRRSGRTTHIAIEIALDMVKHPLAPFYLIGEKNRFAFMQGVVRQAYFELSKHLGLTPQKEELVRISHTSLQHPKYVLTSPTLLRRTLTRGSHQIPTSPVYIYSDHTDGDDGLVGKKRFVRMFFHLPHREGFVRVLDRDGHFLYDSLGEDLRQDFYEHTMCVDDVKSETRWWNFESCWDR